MTLLFANILLANNNIFALGQIAIAQTQPSSNSHSPIRNVESSTSLDKAGDPLTVSTGTMAADGNCEECSFIKYIPEAIGKAGIAYRSVQTLDLSGAQRIVFFAKGELGGENVAFVAIGKPSNTSPVSPNIFKNLNFAVISKNVTLTNNWARYQLSLNGSGATGVTDPFGFIVSKVRSQIQTPANSNNPHIPLTDPNANHITFFLKGVTFDNNPAVKPIPAVQLSSTNKTATNTTATAAATKPTTANSLNTTSPTNITKTTATPSTGSTADTLKGGTGPTTSSTSSSTPTTNNITALTRGNVSLASSPQQPWHQWNESTAWTSGKSPFTNGTYSKAAPITSNPTIPQTLAASSSTTSGRIANGGSIPIKTSTNQNVISSNASVSQNQQQSQGSLVPSQQQTQPSFSTSNSGQSSHIWQNPAGVQSQNQQQSQGSLVPSQQPKQSSLVNSTLQHQYPYQSQAPYPYQSQAPYPYQSQAPYPYQSQAPYPYQSQAPYPYQSQAPYPYQSQAPYPYQSQAPYPYQSQAPYQKQQTTANQPPIANAGISQTVTEATTTTLDGRASYSPIIGNGNIAAYQWTQLPIGIPVALTGANTATPTFTTPIVPTDNTLLAFSLRVMDNHGTLSTNPAVVYVMIKANPPQPNSPPSQIVSPNTLNALPSRVR